MILGRHSVAQAVHHEPGRLVGDARHTVHLVGADALLGGTEKESSHQPFVRRNVAALKHGADHDGELLAASVALVAAGTGGKLCGTRPPLSNIRKNAHRPKAGLPTNSQTFQGLGRFC